MNPRRQSNFSTARIRPEHALLHEVAHLQAQPLIAAGLGDDEAQVGVDHALLGLEVAALDPLGQLDLLGGGQQRVNAGLLEEHLERLAHAALALKRLCGPGRPASALAGGQPASLYAGTVLGARPSVGTRTELGALGSIACCTTPTGAAFLCSCFVPVATSARSPAAAFFKLAQFRSKGSWLHQLFLHCSTCSTVVEQSGRSFIRPC